MMFSAKPARKAVKILALVSFERHGLIVVPLSGRGQPDRNLPPQVIPPFFFSTRSKQPFSV